MRLQYLLIAILFLFVSTYTYAQFRLDLSLNVPIYGGTFNEYEEPGQFVGYPTLIPDIRLHYLLSGKLLTFGVGVRIVTVVAQNFIFPNAFLEIDANPLIFNVSIGGPYVFVYGLETDFYPWVIPDISMYYKLSERFQLGGGTSRSDIRAFGYDLEYYYYYVGVRFIFDL
jgi:hypothetical protein